MNEYRYALRRRRSIQQKDEEGCCTSSMAATADDVGEFIKFEKKQHALSSMIQNLQPINKRFKAESPGEARSKE